MEDVMTTSALVRKEKLTRIKQPARQLALGVMEWMATCASYYAAAGLYERLSKLSDAELRRRGLSRDSLAQSVFGTVGNNRRS
jgi:hypothetical protein